MKHHKKSNQGRFSKKQKKSSRIIMKMRRSFTPQDPQIDLMFFEKKKTVMSVLASVFGRSSKRG